MANGNGERNHKQIGDTVLKATGDKQGDGQNHGDDFCRITNARNNSSTAPGQTIRLHIMPRLTDSVNV